MESWKKLADKCEQLAREYAAAKTEGERIVLQSLFDETLAEAKRRCNADKRNG